MEEYRAAEYLARVLKHMNTMNEALGVFASRTEQEGFMTTVTLEANVIAEEPHGLRTCVAQRRVLCGNFSSCALLDMELKLVETWVTWAVGVTLTNQLLTVVKPFLEARADHMVFVGVQDRVIDIKVFYSTTPEE